MNVFAVIPDDGGELNLCPSRPGDRGATFEVTLPATTTPTPTTSTGATTTAGEATAAG